MDLAFERFRVHRHLAYDSAQEVLQFVEWLKAFTFDQNQRSRSVRITVHVAPEYAADHTFAVCIYLRREGGRTGGNSPQCLQKCQHKR